MFPFAASKGASSAGVGPADSDALLARAPNLKEAAERVVVGLVKSLQKMAGTPRAIEGQVSGLALCETRELFAAHTPAWVAMSLQCPAVPCTMLVMIDPYLVHGLVDLLCGGNGRELAPASPREATALDHQFVQIAVALLAGAIEEHWAEAAFGKASVVKMDSVSAEALGPRIREVGCVDFKLSLFGLAGTLRLALPPAALDRFVAEERGQEFAAQAPDAAWASLFRRELGHARVRLDAFLDGCDIELGVLAALRPGQVIALAADARSRASLVSQGRVLFRGEVGQIGDEHYSVRVDHVIADALRAAPADAVSAPPQISEPLRLDP